MPRTSTGFELSQRITAYYFLFGLTALMCLGFCTILVSIVAISSRAESTCLLQLGRTAPLLAIEFLRGGEKDLVSSLERIRHENSAKSCAIVSNDGRYIAHTRTQQIGKAALNPDGATAVWGDIERIRYFDEQTHLMFEYRTPLRVGDRHLGSFHMVVGEPGFSRTLLVAARHAPWAVAVPLGLVVIGGLTLRRTVRPLSEIESQLRRAATTHSVENLTLDSVVIRGPSSVGWNRIVEQRKTSCLEQNLNHRLDLAEIGLGHKKLDDALNSLTDGIAITDEEWMVTFANRSLLALLQVSRPEEITKKHLVDYLEKKWDLSQDDRLGDPRLQQRSLVVEFDVTQDSSSRTVRIGRHPLRNVDGNISGGCVWYFRDITQQKLAEKMREQFVNTATHELRTPLANIKAYAETLALTEMTDAEQQKEFLNTINTEATRLARFVDDLLSVNSMESGSLTIDRKETDVLRMLNEVTDKVQAQMDQKNITFEKTLPLKIPTHDVDKDKLAATLINLLGNATKYTSEGGRVTLRVGQTDNEIIIDVIDEGFGIADQELPKVFDKFFRSEDPRVQKETGSGLGLSLAREVARLHGGNLSVESKLDEGTTFTLTLPI